MHNVYFYAILYMNIICIDQWKSGANSEFYTALVRLHDLKMFNVKYIRTDACTVTVAPRWTFTDPCKPEVRSGARKESASPAWLAAPAMNARVTTKLYIYGGLILDVTDTI